MKPPSRNLWPVLGCILALYVASYLCLSFGGRFEPDFIGLAGVKTYGWAPTGFVTGYKWNHPLMIFYLPLLLVDQHFWHPADEAYTGKYPIDEVAAADIWKVYVAWNLWHVKPTPPPAPATPH